MHDSTLTLLTYALKDGFLSFDALQYNSTLLAEVRGYFSAAREADSFVQQTALLPLGQGWLVRSPSALPLLAYVVYRRLLKQSSISNPSVKS